MRKARQKLRRSAGIKLQVGILWDSTLQWQSWRNKGSARKIKEMSVAEYFNFHRSVSFFLMEQEGEEFDEITAWETAMFDWHNDTQGRHMLHSEGFFTTTFEVADMWCMSTRVDDYVSFLKMLVTHITTEQPRGQRTLKHCWPRAKIDELEEMFHTET